VTGTGVERVAGTAEKRAFPGEKRPGSLARPVPVPWTQSGQRCLTLTQQLGWSNTSRLGTDWTRPGAEVERGGEATRSGGGGARSRGGLHIFFKMVTPYDGSSLGQKRASGRGAIGTILLDTRIPRFIVRTYCRNTTAGADIENRPHMLWNFVDTLLTEHSVLQYSRANQVAF
jgi:hypothetical protein